MDKTGVRIKRALWTRFPIRSWEMGQIGELVGTPVLSTTKISRFEVRKNRELGTDEHFSRKLLRTDCYKEE